MNNRAWLLVDVLERKEDGNNVVVQGVQIDETTFTIIVNKNYLVPIESTQKLDRAWLLVDFFGQRQNQASVKLPAPILHQGHNIIVDSNKIIKKI